MTKKQDIVEEPSEEDKLMAQRLLEELDEITYKYLTGGENNEKVPSQEN